ncbi:MAG: hypothetical protein D6737_00615 [Chloroflexi bacterium]|nr:MAG: hypothetical protein CUN54_08235 [Phototrophicales bacterium]RMF82798.1 MAG: hypothetical protein D6737_00615 [Chloroflexota bacterium]
MDNPEKVKKQDVEPTESEASGKNCCPVFEVDDICDVLDFKYRQRYNTSIVSNDSRVQVEAVIHARLTRCSGPLLEGDLVYTTTLLPGEQVRLFTADRRTRFSFDSSSNLSYRHEQTSEEKYYMSAMDDFMSDLSVRDDISSSSSKSGSFEGHGDTSGAIETFFLGADVDVGGSWNSQSSADFLRELKQHAEYSHNRSVEATRTASSVSVGEVNRRTHAEGETEDHFEASSRTFSNPNRCHALTFLFHQINKTQYIKFEIVSIRRRVIDPAANSKVANNRFTSRGRVSAIPNAILATDSNRLEVERIGRESVASETLIGQQAGVVNLQAQQQQQLLTAQRLRTAPGFTTFVEPLPPDVCEAARREVDEQLVAQGILAEVGSDRLSDEFAAEINFELATSLPTPGIIVKGCLDECNICEPQLLREINLDLQRKKLENDLLAKQIELLEKSQEYRCCPPETVIND